MARKFMKVVSDGTPKGTYLYDSDGTKLGNVLEMSICIESGEPWLTAEVVRVQGINVTKGVPVELDVQIDEDKVVTKDMVFGEDGELKEEE
jgi:hypothetical protein